MRKFANRKRSGKLAHPIWISQKSQPKSGKYTANDPSVTSFIPGYKVVSGFDLDAYQVHARCILLDTKTGYRSQFLAISGVVSL